MNTTRNPENPYVYNENYWVDAKPYTESILYIVHKTSNISAFVIGIFLVCLLLYLILTKTPPNFKPYSKILLLCVVNDSIILLFHFLMQNRIRISNSTVILSISGPLSIFSYKIQCKFTAFQALSSTVALASLPLQYYYRLSTLKLGHPPQNSKLIVYYVILPIFVVIFMLLCSKAYSSNFENVPDLEYAKLWFEEKPVPQLILGSFYSKWTFFTVFYVVIFLTICYGLIIWLSTETIKELKAQEYILTQRTKILQVQFSRILLFQALTPLITSILPLLFVAYAMITNSSTGYAGELIVFGFTWFPVINSLSNIIFIGPYRQHCLKVLFRYKLLSIRSSNSVADSSQLPISFNTNH